MINFLYLHGFASSPLSRKAKFFEAAIREAGWKCHTPDLNLPTFEKLSISAQMESCLALASTFDDDPLVLVGSSMGGLLAALLYERLPQTVAIILLAPGFGIAERWPALIGEEGMKEWETSGTRSFFHYRAGCELPLHFGFARELSNLKTDDFILEIPTLVFHGVDDQTVPVEYARKFARQNPTWASLVELNDGHELAESLERIWTDSQKFVQTFVMQRQI